MKRTIAALLGLIFAVGVTANAMPIEQFDRMSSVDDGNYITLLLKGSIDGLESHGKKPDADKLYSLFHSGDGIKAIFKNLDTLRALNKKNSTDPNNKQPPYEVEQAFALTLKDNGIIVPLNFLLTINKDFKPTSPLK